MLAALANSNHPVKTVLIIYPHWPPSNLVGVQRVRIVAGCLHRHGWHPVILTVHPRHYEEMPDPHLEKTLRPGLEVIRTEAFPVLQIAGKRLIGDIGLRAFWHTYRRGKALIKNRQIDFIWISMPSWYPALLGRIFHRQAKIPYGIDYQDPWRNQLAPYHLRFSRAWWTNLLAALLEPAAVGKAALLTGVAQPYYQPVLDRYFGSKTIRHTAIQLGFDPADYRLETTEPETPWPTDRSIRPFVYAGALLPHAHLFIQRLFESLAIIKRQAALPTEARFYFLGTGSTNGPTVVDHARAAGVEDLVTEVPDRFPFLHILHFLKAAAGVLIIGSTEQHYTASKTFQCLLSGRPVFAMLHQASEAAAILRTSRADSYLVAYQSDQTPGDFQNKTLETLKRYLGNSQPWAPDLAALAPYSADSAAGKLAAVFDNALENAGRGAHNSDIPKHGVNRKK